MPIDPTPGERSSSSVPIGCMDSPINDYRTIFTEQACLSRHPLTKVKICRGLRYTIWLRRCWGSRPGTYPKTVSSGTAFDRCCSKPLLIRAATVAPAIKRRDGKKWGKRWAGKKDQTQKEVSLKPLVPNARAVLRNRPDRSAPQQRRQALQRRLGKQVRHQQHWQAIRRAAKQVATHDDGQWRQRRRAINTLLIILFVFRLINAPHRQGYEITRSQLWRQGQQQQVPRYQSKPVSGVARCKAREKPDPKAFADRHQAILSTRNCQPYHWRQHRTFAVDGTKMNRPKSLQPDNFLRPGPTAAYPQGLVSCLYQ